MIRAGTYVLNAFERVESGLGKGAGGGHVWWEPVSESDQRVRSAVVKLASLVREGVAVLPFLPADAVHGVGSVLLAPGDRHPLLILDMNWDFTLWSRFIWRSYSGFSGRLYDAFARRGTALSWGHGLFPLERYGIPLALARRMSPRDFEVASVPDDCMLLFAQPPRPLFRGGILLRSGGRLGSVGLAVEIAAGRKDSANGFTTAGHVVDGVAVQRASRVLGVLRRFVGADKILLRADSTTDIGADGYDIAVAVARRRLTFPTALSVAGIAEPDGIDATLYPGCSMWGGMSGVRNGFVFAPMNVMRNGPRWWQNCWTVVGERGWFAKEGDSGAPVTLHGSGKVLGHLVGGIGTEYHGRFELGLVQDIRSQLDHVRTKFGVELS